MSLKKVTFQDFGGRETAESILERARAEAKRMIDEAKRNADKIEQVAYEQGFAQGEQAGVKMGMAKAQPNVDGMVAAVEEFNRLLLTTLEAMEPDIVELVRAIAAKVLHTVLAQDNEILVKIVRAAMAEVDKKWEVTIRINPQEFDTVSRFGDEFTRIREMQKVTIVADPGVPSGGCRVEYPQGFVGASLEHALDELFRAEDL